LILVLGERSLSAGAALPASTPDPVAALLELSGVLSEAESASQQVAARLKADNPSIPPEVWSRYAALASDRATLLAMYGPIYSGI
jgi:hypothetical protein